MKASIVNGRLVPGELVPLDADHLNDVQKAYSDDARKAALDLIAEGYRNTISHPNFDASKQTELDALMLSAADAICGETIPAKINAYIANPYGIGTLPLHQIMDNIKAGKICDRAAKAERDARIAAIPAPTRPVCLPEGNWNGKLYGSDRKGYTVYIDGKRIKLDKWETAEVKSYIEALAAYKAQVGAI